VIEEELVISWSTIKSVVTRQYKPNTPACESSSDAEVSCRAQCGGHQQILRLQERQHNKNLPTAGHQRSLARRYPKKSRLDENEQNPVDCGESDGEGHR